MKYSKSKTLSYGSVCTFRGNKIIRANRRTKHIAGVWQMYSEQHVMDLNGNITHIIMPEGLVVRGYTSVATLDTRKATYIR